MLNIQYIIIKCEHISLKLLLKKRIILLSSRNNSVTPMQQLLIALRLYSTNGFLITMGDYGGMDKSTVSRIIVRVSEAIASLAHNYIKLP